MQVLCSAFYSVTHPVALESTHASLASHTLRLPLTAEPRELRASAPVRAPSRNLSALPGFSVGERPCGQQARLWAQRLGLQPRRTGWSADQGFSLEQKTSCFM